MKFFKNKFNFLLAFADTEGIETKNGLWSMTIIIKALVESKDPELNCLSKLKFKKSLFHLLSFNSNDNAVGSVSTSKALKSHFKTLIFLKEKYKAAGVLVCCWNAKHDMNQLTNHHQSFPELNLNFIDAIPFVKSISTFPSYKLENVKKIYFKQHKQRHTSLEDTLDMIKVLGLVVVDYKSLDAFDKLSTINQTIEIYKNLKPDYILRSIIESETFLKGLIEVQRRTISITDKPINPKYEYFCIDDAEFKVRIGWKGRDRTKYKGYGLYEKIDEKFHLIRNQRQKIQVLEAYTEKLDNPEPAVQLLELE